MTKLRGPPLSGFVLSFSGSGYAALPFATVLAQRHEPSTRIRGIRACKDCRKVVLIIKSTFAYSP